MKVYIKPWEEALKCAKEFDERLDEGTLVNTFNGVDYILGIMRRYGDWGRIVEAKKCSGDIFDYYVTYYHDEESFSYPDCCIEEIDFAWLDAHAEIIDEQVVSQTIQCTDDEPIILGQDYIFTVYKVKDGAKKYFFYAKRISNDIMVGNVEKVIEIN